MAKWNSVDEYAADQEGWKVEAVEKLAGIVRSAAPKSDEEIKWAQPVWSSNGPFCYTKAFKTSINFGFSRDPGHGTRWRGIDLDDPKGLLSGDGEKMRHVKITALGDIKVTELKKFVRQAVKLNAAKGDPTKG